MPKSCVKVNVFDMDGERKVIGLSIAEQKAFRGFPADARIRLRLSENKIYETLEFGTLGEPKASADLKNTFFRAPSCQLRVFSTENNTGLLLGSTDNWTLRTDDEGTGDNAQEGILLFQPADIAPRTWKLDIREQEHPVVYVDTTIPDSRTWVRNDPVFIGCVFPAIVHQIFEEIYQHQTPQEIPWMKDWLGWADSLMPGSKIPSYGEDRSLQVDWMENLIDTFSKRHHLLDRLVVQLTTERVA